MNTEERKHDLHEETVITGKANLSRTQEPLIVRVYIGVLPLAMNIGI